MSDGTKIEWTDATWNPVTGCTKISDGCTHCYIDRTPPFRMAHRRFQHPDPIGGASDRIGASTGVQLHPERLTQPISWRKPRRIFVCSLADLFHDDVPDDHIARVWAIMANARQHTFQILTKRPARMRALLTSDAFLEAVHRACTTFPYRVALNGYRGAPAVAEGVRRLRQDWPLHNVWLGVSAESQQWANTRIPVLLDTPAAVRWVSAEPLLGPIDLYGQQDAHGHRPHRLYAIGPGQPYFPPGPPGSFLSEPLTERPTLDWVVAGGESGPKSRPMHPEWARSLRDQCAEAGVPFLFKQWGDWTDTEHGLNAVGDDAPIFRRTVGNVEANGHRMQAVNGTTMVRLGKGNAGRLLDGRTHDGYPSGGAR